MPEKRIVQQGECVSSIAYGLGFAVDKVWNDGANDALRELRGDPFVLLPGDELTIPDKDTSGREIATGKVHRFRRRDVPEKLQLRIVDDDTPRADVAYVLDTGKTKISGRTDADGWVQQWIPPDLKSATLTLADTEETITLEIGSLDPVDEASGALSRLANLGYAPDEAHVGEAEREAMVDLALLLLDLDAVAGETSTDTTISDAVAVIEAAEEVPLIDPERAEQLRKLYGV